ncbi:MAG: nitrous oxide reductase family maturation protein NosD, partial [bacterium]|nr:nitrous oxide reductase family maturation protein NosD [bacterium]
MIAMKPPRRGVGTLLCLLILALPGVARAVVHRVGAGEKITPVLERASPGDTVWLEEGEYRENLVVEVPVRLTGENHPHVRGGYQGVVIHVK